MFVNLMDEPKAWAKRWGRALHDNPTVQEDRILAGLELEQRLAPLTALGLTWTLNCHQLNSHFNLEGVYQEYLEIWVFPKGHTSDWPDRRYPAGAYKDRVLLHDSVHLNSSSHGANSHGLLCSIHNRDFYGPNAVADAAKWILENNPVKKTESRRNTYEVTMETFKRGV